MINDVEFYGSLAKRYGKEQTVWGDTPRSCIVGLDSKLPGLRRELIKGQNWQLFLNDKKVKQVDLDTPIEEKCKISIVPVISGGDPFTAAFYIISAIMLVSAVYLYTQMPDGGEGGNTKSFIFNGAVNSNEQGGPVPLVYGHARVGSVVISSAITNEEMQDDKYSQGFEGPGGPYRGSIQFR